MIDATAARGPAVVVAHAAAPPLRRRPVPPPAPPVAALLDEAPAGLERLHARATVGDGDRSAEAQVTDAFTANAALAASALTVTCSAAACEVHGTAPREETAARLAVRAPGFLDAIERLGYVMGTDLVSGRGPTSEFVVYLDRVR